MGVNGPRSATACLQCFYFGENSEDVYSNLSISLTGEFVKSFPIEENRLSITFLLSIHLYVPNKKIYAIYLAAGNVLFRLNMYSRSTAVAVTVIYVYISIIQMLQPFMGRALFGLQKTNYKIRSCRAHTKFTKKNSIFSQELEQTDQTRSCTLQKGVADLL